MIELNRELSGRMTVTLTEEGDEEEFFTAVNQEAGAQAAFEPSIDPSFFVIAPKDAMCFLTVNSKGKYQLAYQLSSLTPTDFLLAFPATEAVNKVTLAKQYDLTIVPLVDFMAERRKNLSSLISTFHMIRNELLFSSSTIH